MARNVALSIATDRLKAEIGASLETGVATSDDQRLYRLLDSKQQWLFQEYDWPFMKQRGDLNIVAGTRYYTLPVTLAFERPVNTFVIYSRTWQPVDFGISINEYNALSSGDAGITEVRQDPIRRWDWKSGSTTDIEVWPVPLSNTTMRFEGCRPLTDLKNGGASYVTSQTLDLDDELVVLYTAAEILTREKQPDAKMKLALAEQRLNRLRAMLPVRTRQVVLGRSSFSPDRPQRRNIPITLTA